MFVSAHVHRVKTHTHTHMHTHTFTDAQTQTHADAARARTYGAGDSRDAASSHEEWGHLGQGRCLRG